MGTHTTDQNSHHDICPGSICPGDICPMSISVISQLLLARFGSNCKQRVLGTYTTDNNCHHDICPGNFCPGDICPYQQYLSCYQPDLDQTLNKGSWEHIQQITTVTTTLVQVTFVHISNISAFQAEHFRLQSCSCIQSIQHTLR